MSVIIKRTYVCDLCEKPYKWDKYKTFKHIVIDDLKRVTCDKCYKKIIKYLKKEIK